MALDVATFAKTRPYSYHLTSHRNLRSIERHCRIDSAVTLILKDGRTELLRQRRLEHLVVNLAGRKVWLRDQAPLHRGNLTLEGGWSFDHLVEALNSRVFFWPGAENGPNDYGRRHFGRYLAERPLIIRVRTAELLDANKESPAEFCRHNSGSPRYSVGRPSPRGPNTFLTAAHFPGPPSKVVELTFSGAAVLPGSWDVGPSPDGPWRSRSMCARRAV